MEKFSNNWKRRRGNFMGGRSIIDIVCALQILGVVLFLTAPQFVMNYLILNPAADPSRPDLAYCYIFSVPTCHYRF